MIEMGVKDIYLLLDCGREWFIPGKVSQISFVFLCPDLKEHF